VAHFRADSFSKAKGKIMNDDEPQTERSKDTVSENTSGLAPESEGLGPFQCSIGVIGYESDINGADAVLMDFKPTRGELRTLAYHYLDRYFAVEEMFAMGQSGSWEIRESPFTWRRFCSIAEALSPGKPIKDYESHIAARRAEVNELLQEVESGSGLEDTFYPNDRFTTKGEATNQQSNDSTTTLYLCRIRSGMDDVPVYLSRDYQSAVKMAMATEWDLNQDVLEATGTMGGGMPVMVDIITFIDGHPVSQESVRDYDDDRNDDC
jgi:hypothetical protein